MAYTVRVDAAGASAGTTIDNKPAVQPADTMPMKHDAGTTTRVDIGGATTTQQSISSFTTKE